MVSEKLKSAVPLEIKRGPRQSKRRRAESAGNELDYTSSQSTSEISGKAQGTLFDAVAGRLDDQGFILNGSRKPVAPDEALFRRKDAPVRYEEDDRYFAHGRLPAHVRLPDSELLKAIHAYVSDFYASSALGDTENDYKSMDETALIAMGVLLEETCRQELGKTGDLAFLENEDSCRLG